MTGPTARHRDGTGSGPGRLLVAVYGVLALAATARGLYQVATKLDEAPVAYVLSLAARASSTSSRRSRWPRDRRRLAWADGRLRAASACSSSATLSLVDVGDFPDETVWSPFGAGYGYVPLVLPFVGLWWLWRTGVARPDGPAERTATVG